ncbi:MAG TPA: hypothetical protein VN714_30430 [Trebonia sp.]|nr:hypothetical protein [Trebonia sp.]
MEIFTTNVAAARLGAACLSARTPWTNSVAAGANHALGRKLSTIAGTPDARGGASWRVQPMSVQTPQFAALGGVELLPTTVRKPNNVHTTRIDAGGYGAMGPHPERERLA